MFKNWGWKTFLKNKILDEKYQIQTKTRKIYLETKHNMSISVKEIIRDNTLFHNDLFIVQIVY